MAASSDEASGDWPPGTIVCENRGLWEGLEQVDANARDELQEGGQCR